MQTLRSHEHDLGTVRDLRRSQRHFVDQKLPYQNRPAYRKQKKNQYLHVWIFEKLNLEIKKKKKKVQNFRVRKRKTFEDELLAAWKDVGERLEKGLEVFNGGVQRQIRDRYRCPAELHIDTYGGLLTDGGGIALHFLLLLLLPLFLLQKSSTASCCCQFSQTFWPFGFFLFVFSPPRTGPVTGLGH